MQDKAELLQYIRSEPIPCTMMTLVDRKVYSCPRGRLQISFRSPKLELIQESRSTMIE